MLTVGFETTLREKQETLVGVSVDRVDQRSRGVLPRRSRRPAANSVKHRKTEDGGKMGEWMGLVEPQRTPVGGAIRTLI